jgi:hypothetical protein
MIDRVSSFAMLLLIVSGLPACDNSRQMPAQSQKITYAEDVAPILEKHCTACHVTGQKGTEESGLVLDSYETLMKGSQFGPVIDPGSATSSSLYILISGKTELTVSMPHGRNPLATEEIDTIRVWIDNGAIEN